MLAGRLLALAVWEDGGVESTYREAKGWHDPQVKAARVLKATAIFFFNILDRLQTHRR